MKIETIVVGPIETNCYIVSDPVRKEAVIIDAGDDADVIWEYVQKEQLQVKYLLNTHGHFDHIQANDVLREKTGAPLAIHAEDEELLEHPEKVSDGMYMQVHGCRPADLRLHQGDTISFGAYTLHVIYTPGHSRGGCCFYEIEEKVCFTGDTLFRRSVGRTDLYGGDYGTLLKSVRDRLQVVADNVTIYPGHGPETTMAFERKNNPYLQ